jgi:hypothetical protein
LVLGRLLSKASVADVFDLVTPVSRSFAIGKFIIPVVNKAGSDVTDIG